jgi:hypothetical protein
MTTYSHTGPATHTTDADYQARMNEFFAACAAVMTHVPQTGEVALPSAATRVANTYHWRMYRLNGSLHATAPVYVKLFFGLTTDLSETQGKMAVGTAVDGSGNFVGVAVPEIALGQANVGPVAGDFITYACGVDNDGAFVIFKSGSASASTRAALGFFVYRTCDVNGAATSVGVICGRPLSSSNNAALASSAYSLRFASPNVTINLGGYFTPAIGTDTSSGGLGGEIEAYLSYTRVPLTQPMHALCGVWPTEFPVGTVFSATLVGSSPRTYISMGLNGNANNESARHLAFAFLWE